MEERDAVDVRVLLAVDVPVADDEDVTELVDVEEGMQGNAP